MSNTECKPVVKWAGGKRQLLSVLTEMMPDDYDTYYEPFFGGGALFFKCSPQKATINDLNTNLITMYQCIRDIPMAFLNLISYLEEEYNHLNSDEEKKEYYYKIRDCFNEGIKNNDTSCQQAAYFLFLNKACFNGVYRENSKGLFNVPTGRKKQIKTYDMENIFHVSYSLQNTNILNTDYKHVCNTANENDFIFFDPPYYDTFSDYQKNGFGKEDQEELADLFSVLTKRKIKCMLTNSNTDFIKELYKDYSIHVVPVKRMINRNSDGRTGEEVIITNY